MRTLLLATLTFIIGSFHIHAESPRIQVHISASITDAEGQIVTTPSVTAKNGASVSISITDDMSVSDDYKLPKGIVLAVTPKVEGSKVIYSGQLTLRDVDSLQDADASSLLAFKTTELLFSGATATRKPVRFNLPDGSIVTLELSIQDLEGNPIKKG